MASVSQSSQPHTTEISPCLSVLQLPEPAEFAGVGGLIGGLCVHPIIGKVPGSHLLVSRLEEASCRHAQGTEAVASSLSLSLDIKAFLCLHLTVFPILTPLDKDTENCKPRKEVQRSSILETETKDKLGDKLVTE